VRIDVADLIIKFNETVTASIIHLVLRYLRMVQHDVYQLLACNARKTVIAQNIFEATDRACSNVKCTFKPTAKQRSGLSTRL